MPLATVLTPNQFECEQLTGKSITTEEEAVSACVSLLAQGPEVVVITSCDLPSDPEHIIMLAGRKSSRGSGSGDGDGDGDGDGGGGGGGVGHPHEEPLPKLYRLAIPKIEGRYTGTGAWPWRHMPKRKRKRKKRSYFTLESTHTTRTTHTDAH